MAILQRSFVVPKINLIPKDPFYDTLLGKVLVWSIQVGRYIIVFTEVIVIISFATRFKLDRDLTDLTSQVTQKKSIVASFGDVESRTRQIQEKISTVSKLINERNAVYYMNKLTTRIPAGIELSTLSYEAELLSFTGKANTSGSLAGLITSLQQEPAFSSVSVDRINSGDANDTTVQFSMKIDLPVNPIFKILASPAPTNAPQADQP